MLIGKLASGDMVAIEAKYHLKCLVKLYNKARNVSSCYAEKVASSSFEPIDAEELAFAELVAFIDESLQVEELRSFCLYQILLGFIAQNSVN